MGEVIAGAILGALSVSIPGAVTVLGAVINAAIAVGVSFASQAPLPPQPPGSTGPVGPCESPVFSIAINTVPAEATP